MPLKPAIVADAVVYRYDGATALGASSFEIPSAAITALIGPNGSGKSTILNGIAGLKRPSSGRLQVLESASGRRRVAYVLQTTKVNQVLPVTVGEVVTMGRYSTLGSHRRVGPRDRAAVEDAIDRMGLSSLVNRHLHELSAGQRQRVFVAQGLAQDHDVLLLDEPLTGLDMTSARAIDDVIHDEHQRGCTVVITTHDLGEARVADHVLLLAGRVVASGPPSEVLTAHNLTAAYGPNLLHLEADAVFLDDPAHLPVPGRHVHRDQG